MVLVAGILCLLIATMVATNVVRLVVRNSRVVLANRARLQAEWLAEAGLQRGLAASRANDAYGGETWEVTAAELGSDLAGSVVIEVVRDPVAGDYLSATAVYPTDVPTRATCERRVSLDPPNAAEDTTSDTEPATE